MIEDVLASLFLLFCLASSFWMIHKAFGERHQDAIARRNGEEPAEGIRWGFGYQLMLGVLSLSLTAAGVVGLVRDLIRIMRS